MQKLKLLVSTSSLRRHAARRREEIKQVSNIRPTSVSFFYQVEGTFVHIIRAYTAVYLGGTPSQRTGTSPPSCLLLDNRLFMTVVKWANTGLQELFFFQEGRRVKNPNRPNDSIITVETFIDRPPFYMSKLCISHEYYFLQFLSQKSLVSRICLQLGKWQNGLLTPPTTFWNGSHAIPLQRVM